MNWSTKIEGVERVTLRAQPWVRAASRLHPCADRPALRRRAGHLSRPPGAQALLSRRSSVRSRQERIEIDVPEDAHARARRLDQAGLGLGRNPWFSERGSGRAAVGGDPPGRLSARVRSSAAGRSRLELGRFLVHRKRREHEDAVALSELGDTPLPLPEASELSWLGVAGYRLEL